jgi:hypothetical protein
MSGSPKYSRAELQRQEQERLEQERRREAQEEEKKRIEALKTELIRQLNIRKGNLKEQVQLALDRLQQKSFQMYRDSYTKFKASLDELLSQIQQAKIEADLDHSSARLSLLESNINRAISRKRQDDIEKKHQAELDKLQSQSEELATRLSHISSGEAEKFDSSGKVKVELAVLALNNALLTKDVTKIKAALFQATELANLHIKTVEANRSEWETQKMTASTALSQLKSLIVGYKADSNLMKWSKHHISEFEEQVKLAEEAIASENFNQPEIILISLKARGEKLIEQANQAQIDADKRDYILQAFCSSLANLGYIVSQPKPEHPEHPATAYRLIAKDSTGRGFITSVPLQGDIHFEAQGYQKTQRGKISVCDEAEVDLNNILQGLNKYGVDMGELQWQGKDSDRLPSHGRAKDLSIESEESRHSN